MTTKRSLNALKNTMVLFAGAHLVILAYLALATQNFTYVNLFAILDLQEFVPGIELGVISGIFSAAVGLLVYAFFYFRGKKRA